MHVYRYTYIYTYIYVCICAGIEMSATDADWTAPIVHCGKCDADCTYNPFDYMYIDIYVYITYIYIYICVHMCRTRDECARRGPDCGYRPLRCV